MMLVMSSGCKHENSGIVPQLPEGVKSIELVVATTEHSERGVLRSVSDGTTITRAYGAEEGDKYEGVYGTDLNENVIDNVEVFLFHTDGTLKKRFSGSDLQKEGREKSATLRMLIPNQDIAQYEGKKFRVVVVANATVNIPSAITRISDLQALVQETSDINAEPATPQSKFLMDGEVDSQTINWGGSVTYTVPTELQLRRALAKIRLRIKNIAVDVTENNQKVHYEMVGDPKVKLVHYVGKSSLLQGKPYEIKPGDWKSSEYRTMSSYSFPGMQNDATPDKPRTFLSAGLPFYAYENDWTDDSARETYLTLQITFKAKNPQTGVYGENKAYYYRIPINYRLPLADMTDEEKKGLYKAQRNYLYDIVSSIGVLGSEDEGEPFELEAFVAVQPWNEPDVVDGAIRNAHFLVVKELHPLMPNMNTREVRYLSDLALKPISAGSNEIKITQTVFEYYDQKGDHFVFKDNGTNVVATKNGGPYKTFTYGQSYSDFPPFKKFGGAKVTFDESNPNDKKLIIKHDVPTNYVPYEIYFRVEHVKVSTEQGTPLYKDVHVTQYPPKYITGKKSPGYKPNSGDSGPYADFRFHDLLGVANTDQASGNYGAQSNDVFYRVTTIVNSGTEKIGDPTDPTTEKTLRTPEANQLISPEFIIASQHGLANPESSQYGNKPIKEYLTSFWNGFGPYSGKFQNVSPYYHTVKNPQDVYGGYKNAEDRCYNYFEGEYGTDGDYVEHYVERNYWGGNNGWKTRTISKKFKYQGRWRIPTAAELEYINDIQDAKGSAVKSLLFGQYYWTAQTGKAFNFNDNRLSDQTGASIRCVFDTYKLKVNDKD